MAAEWETKKNRPGVEIKVFCEECFDNEVKTCTSDCFRCYELKTCEECFEDETTCPSDCLKTFPVYGEVISIGCFIFVSIVIYLW